MWTIERFVGVKNYGGGEFAIKGSRQDLKLKTGWAGSRFDSAIEDLIAADAVALRGAGLRVLRRCGCPRTAGAVAASRARALGITTSTSGEPYVSRRDTPGPCAASRHDEVEPEVASFPDAFSVEIPESVDYWKYNDFARFFKDSAIAHSGLRSPRFNLGAIGKSLKDWNTLEPRELYRFILWFTHDYVPSNRSEFTRGFPFWKTFLAFHERYLNDFERARKAHEVIVNRANEEYWLGSQSDDEARSEWDTMAEEWEASQQM